MSKGVCIICKGETADSRAKKCKSCHFKTRKFSKETRSKMRKAKKENPTNYWLGKKRPEMSGDKNPLMRWYKNGGVTWNKGISWDDDTKEKLRKAHKGRRHSPDTEFKKGQMPVNYGNVTSVSGAHRHIRREYGSANKCEFCESTKHVEWSNKDHLYNIDPDDWQQLCRKCHMEYDVKNNGRTPLH